MKIKQILLNELAALTGRDGCDIPDWEYRDMMDVVMDAMSEIERPGDVATIISDYVHDNYRHCDHCNRRFHPDDTYSFDSIDENDDTPGRYCSVECARLARDLDNFDPRREWGTC